MTEEIKWPRQNDPEIRETNIGILRQVMGLLYETHITEQSTANKRGEAIQAVNAMLSDLGFTDGISEQEKISFSQRIENSEIWNKDGHGD